MSKSLEDRLRGAKVDFAKAAAGLTRHASKMPKEIVAQFDALAAFSADVEGLVEMLQARSAARRLLDGLETRADQNDLVELGAGRAKFHHVRLIGVQAYLGTSWALADRLVAMAGRIVCTPQASFDAVRPAQLVAQFIQNDRKKQTASALYESVRQTFGWPIAVSYALRNHFLHEGGHLGGVDFFDGPTAASGFAASATGWSRVEERAKSYGVSTEHHRVGSWPATPVNDLRVVLDVCEREVDDSLGVLIGSASSMLVTHIGFIVGED